MAASSSADMQWTSIIKLWHSHVENFTYGTVPATKAKGNIYTQVCCTTLKEKEKSLCLL